MRILKILKILQLLLLVALALPAHGQNWILGKVTYAVPEVNGQLAVIGWNAGICFGTFVPGRFNFTAATDHPYFTYSGIWRKGQGSREYLSDGTYVVIMHGELAGTFTPYVEQGGKWVLDEANARHAPAYFLDQEFDTQSGMATALGCGGLQVIFTPND